MTAKGGVQDLLKIAISGIDHDVYSGYYAIGAVDHSAAITPIRYVTGAVAP
jgi:hypothetical protein